MRASQRRSRYHLYFRALLNKTNVEPEAFCENGGASSTRSTGARTAGASIMAPALS